MHVNLGGAETPRAGRALPWDGCEIMSLSSRPRWTQCGYSSQVSALNLVPPFDCCHVAVIGDGAESVGWTPEGAERADSSLPHSNAGSSL